MEVYNLVHIICSGEYKTPLVASQIFDRVQAQATIDGVGKPLSVSVWIMVPMREVFSKKSRLIIQSIKQRCPNIHIELVGGISRLNNWPAIRKMTRLRSALGKTTIYHCRGESSVEWVYHLKNLFPSDKIIFDVRGYWPLERLAEKDVTNDVGLHPDQQEQYNKDVNNLREKIKIADLICTVSEPLLEMLVKEADAPANSWVIPCYVKNVIPDTNRDKIRKELNIENKTAILYLGGTQKYQHLEDLVIPFIKSTLSLSENNVAVVITQNRDKMTELLSKFEIDKDRIRLISVSQDKVGDYLTGVDIGLLLRAPSLLIKTSLPVKFGEYLSAGIPIVLEEGMSHAANILNNYKIGCIISLSDKKNSHDFDMEVKKALEWFEKNRSTIRTSTRAFVEEYYTWKANIQTERNMYIQVLMKTGNI